MHPRCSIIFLVLAVALASAHISPAAVVFRPKNKARYVTPGEEEINGNAQELFQVGQAAENSGDLSRATKAYRTLVRRYPKDTLAAGAAYRLAVLLEQRHEYLKAVQAYRILAETYPRSARFDEAIEAQFRIGAFFLDGQKVKFLGIPVRSGLDHAVTIFAGIVRAAPYGKYAARAQFNIGRATEKQKNPEAAVAAYQAVIEKYPDEPVAADAQYQIGYLWFITARYGSRDAKAYNNAKLGFQDFLFRYPKSEKVAQARENLRILEAKQTSNAFQVAKFYDKQKNYRAAVIYYNDVIRQQPGSPPADQAKRRIEQLRAKVGDAALQSAAISAATAKGARKSSPAEGPGSGSSGVPSLHTSPDDVAPLPPPETDESLPPPASLTPDTTTAPDVPSATPTPAASGSPGE